MQPNESTKPESTSGPATDPDPTLTEPSPPQPPVLPDQPSVAAQPVTPAPGPGPGGPGQPFSSAYPQFYTPYGHFYYRRPTNGLAIASMVVSIASVPLACVFYGLPGLLGAAGAVMGHIARGQIRDNGEEGDGLALTGIIVGWIMTGIAVLALLVGVFFLVLLLLNTPDPPR